VNIIYFILNKMKIFTIILSFIFCTQIYAPITAQQVITILDKITLQPIEGVRVTIDIDNTPIVGYNPGQKTDANGKVLLQKTYNLTDLLYIKHNLCEVLIVTLEEAMRSPVLITTCLNSIEDVVVTATRGNENKKFIAQPIQTVKATEIAFQQQSTVPDILQSNGNVFMQKSQLGGGSPVIRGFETNKVLLLVDGVRMNNAIYRGGHVQNALTLDGAILDRVEIAYGPSSVMYGSDALGGVMNFITKKPAFSLTDKVLVKAGAYTRYQSAANAIQANANVTVANNNVSSLTSFTYSTFNDLRQGAMTNKYDTASWNRTWYAKRFDSKDSMVMQNDGNTQTGSGYTQIDFLQKLLFKQSNIIHHVLNFQYSTSSDVPRYDRLTQLEGVKPKFAEWYYGPQNRLMLSYQLQLARKTKLFSSGNVTAAYQHITESRIQRRFGKNNRISNIEDVFVSSINADFQKKIGRFEVNYGAEIQSNEVQSTANSTNIISEVSAAAPTRYFDGKTTYNSSAIYLASVYKITEKLVLNAGARASIISLRAIQKDTQLFAIRIAEKTSQNNKSVTGNIGLVYLPRTNLKFYSLLATGFRAPNVDDLGSVFEKPNGGVIIPNSMLKSESTINGEIGVQAIISKIINVSVSAYHTKYLNAILLVNSTYNGSDSVPFDGKTVQVLRNQNELKAYIGGLETTLGVKPFKGFEINSSFTFTRGRIMSGVNWGKPLDHIPPTFGRTSVSYSMKKLKVEIWSAFSAWKRISEYRLNAEDNEANATSKGMPAWATFNIRAGYQINKMFGIQAAIENMADIRYRTFASNIGSPGRNFILTLRGNF
jgi:hemoglobin/transferrin/lactoferrin receptor protein